MQSYKPSKRVVDMIRTVIPAESAFSADKIAAIFELTQWNIPRIVEFITLCGVDGAETVIANKISGVNSSAESVAFMTAMIDLERECLRVQVASQAPAVVAPAVVAPAVVDPVAIGQIRIDGGTATTVIAAVAHGGLAKVYIESYVNMQTIRATIEMTFEDIVHCIACVPVVTDDVIINNLQDTTEIIVRSTSSVITITPRHHYLFVDLLNKALTVVRA